MHVSPQFVCFPPNTSRLHGLDEVYALGPEIQGHGFRVWLALLRFFLQERQTRDFMRLRGHRRSMSFVVIDRDEQMFAYVHCMHVCRITVWTLQMQL